MNVPAIDQVPTLQFRGWLCDGVFAFVQNAPTDATAEKNDLTPMTCKIGEPAQAIGGKKTEAIEDLEQKTSPRRSVELFLPNS